MRLVVAWLKQAMYWFLLFTIQRTVFLIVHWELIDEKSSSNVFGVYSNSIRLDFALICYLILLPMLVLLLKHIISKENLTPIFNGINKWYYRILVVIMAMIHAGELAVYREWNTKLSSRVFMHLKNPSEVFQTASGSHQFTFYSFLVVEVILGLLLLRFVLEKSSIYKKEKEITTNIKIVGWKKIVSLSSVFALLFAVSVTGGRGGVQEIPINIGAAMYSEDHVLNDISINSTYFFIDSWRIFMKTNLSEFFSSVDLEKANQTVEEMYNYPKEHDVRILNKKDPNIVIVLLESWSAEAISSMSTHINSTPNFDAITEEGLLFEQLYASSGTSEIGNASLFCGYPVLPEVSITLQPAKNRKLKSFNQDFQEKGYSSSYLFGGDLRYGNIEGFLIDHKFQQIEDVRDLTEVEEKGKLNVYDRDLLNSFLNRVDVQKEPFLSCVFTGSTHSPFDLPEKYQTDKKSEEEKFMNSLIYSDECLGEFVKKCKTKEWYANTLFIFIADHGRTSPDVLNPNHPSFFRIPMLIWGEPLEKEYKGKRISKIGSQADVAATLLNQFDMPTDSYSWSKDLLNPQVPEFALHTISRGYGWLTPEGHIAYHMQFKKYVENTFLKDTSGLAKIETQCQHFTTSLYNHFESLEE